MTQGRRYLRRLVNRLARLQSILIIFGFVAAPFWSLAELLTHFVPIYALCFLIASVVGSWKWITGVVLLSAWMLIGAGQPQLPMQSPTLIFYNSKVDNSQKLADWQEIVTAHQPDFLALVEADKEETRGLQSSYSYGCGTQDKGIFGVVFLSRSPILNCVVYEIGDYPFIRAQTGEGMVVYVLHPPPPLGRLSADNHRYLEQVANRIKEDNLPALVVGDFNQSPYSPTYMAFWRNSHTHPQMMNATPTWKPFYLHIDHVFASKPLIANVEALPWAHSDHRALKVKVAQLIEK